MFTDMNRHTASVLLSECSSSSVRCNSYKLGIIAREPIFPHGQASSVFIFIVIHPLKQFKYWVFLHVVATVFVANCHFFARIVWVQFKYFSFYKIIYYYTYQCYLMIVCNIHCIYTCAAVLELWPETVEILIVVECGCISMCVVDAWPLKVMCKRRKKKETLRLTSRLAEIETRSWDSPSLLTAPCTMTDPHSAAITGVVVLSVGGVLTIAVCILCKFCLTSKRAQLWSGLSKVLVKETTPPSRLRHQFRTVQENVASLSSILSKSNLASWPENYFVVKYSGLIVLFAKLSSH